MSWIKVKGIQRRRVKGRCAHAAIDIAAGIDDANRYAVEAKRHGRC
jgi:hypothetical protein